jgi:hypothetical protein
MAGEAVAPRTPGLLNICLLSSTDRQRKIEDLLEFPGISPMDLPFH